MPVDRDTIQVALLARLVGSLGASLKSSTRQMKTWDDVLAMAQPALVLTSRDGSMTYSPLGMPPENTLVAEGAFFVRTGSSGSSAETTLLDLLEGVETALLKQPGEQPQDDFSTTLGGLVFRCRLVSYALHQAFGQEAASLTFTVEMLVV